MENVEGILLGNAIEYSREIYRKLNAIGYKVMHKLLKGEQMGVPQTRHRVFFIATQNDFDFENLDLNFNYEKIPYNVIKFGGAYFRKTQKALIAKKVKESETDLRSAMKREKGRKSYFSEKVVWGKNVCPTLTSGGSEIWIENTGTHLNDNETINIQTFPQDYDFCGQNVKYICGMSVPPIMIKRIVTRLIESGIFKEQKNEQRTDY